MWRMVLTYDSDSLTININDLPRGFGQMGYKLKVNPTNNVIREFTEEFGFTETSRTWIKSKIAADGLDIIIECSIEYFENSEWKILIDGIINLEGHNEERFFINANVSDSSFNTKLNDRSKLEIDYNSKYSLGGLETLGFLSDFFDLSLTGSDGAGGYEATSIKVIPPFELVTKLLQKITDFGHDLLKSSILGRTNLSSNGFNASYDYAVNGDLSLVMFSKGLLISGILPNENNSKVSGKTDFVTNFDYIFQVLNLIQPLGMAVEYIDGLPYIIIEELSYFFKNKQYSFVLEKGDISDIRKKPISEFFNNIYEVGYTKFSKDNEEGLSDYSGKVSYTSPLINFSNTQSIISNFSASPADIERARANPVSGRSKDTEAFDTDEAIFVIDAYYDGATLKSRDNIEGWQSVVTGIYGAAPLYTNLRIRPTQCIYNRGRWIKTSLLHNTGEYLKFQGAENLSKVSSQLTGSTIVVTDNTNIAIDDLAPDTAVLLSGMQIDLNASLSPGNFAEIRDYPGYYLKYWSEIDDDYNYIWLRETSINPTDGSDFNIMGWEPRSITALEPTYMEFEDESDYIEFEDESSMIEFEAA